MKKLVLAAAAAGTVLIAGVAAANAQWSLGNRSAADGSDAYASAYASGGAECGFVTVHERRAGRVIVRRIPRC
jgi:hypothetical protein